MMSDGADYVKYVTERMIRYWEEPEAREQRRERKLKREPWVIRWFGQLLPLGIGIWWSERKSAEDSKQGESLPGSPQPADYS